MRDAGQVCAGKNELRLDAFADSAKGGRKDEFDMTELVVWEEGEEAKHGWKKETPSTFCPHAYPHM